MMRFSGLHVIAAQRGDGLRPELLRLLEQSRVDVDAQQAATRCTGNGDSDVRGQSLGVGSFQEQAMLATGQDTIDQEKG
jgi:hypothetical protein